MMFKKIYPFLKIYLLCGLLGATVYFFFRDSLLLSNIERDFQWFHKIRVESHIEIDGPVAYFFKYLFGDAVFAYANGRAIGFGYNNKKISCIYASVISCSIEILQGLNVIYGVFDMGDIVVSIIFAILGVLVSETIEIHKLRAEYNKIYEEKNKKCL